MVDIIVSAVIAAIVGAACVYIYKEKKKGTKCIGCPMAGNCHSCQDTKTGSQK